MERNYEARERQISFHQLWWKFLQSWRAVLVCVLFFAALVTAMRYGQDMRSLQNVDEEPETHVDNMLDLLSEEEIETVNSVLEANKRLTEIEDYNENSILMNIDPFHVHTVSLQYYVDTDYRFNLSQDIGKDVTMDIAGAYCAYVSNMGESLDNDQTGSYLTELLSTEATKDTGIFTVYVKGKNLEEAGKLADCVEEAMETYRETLSEKIADHELILLNRSAAVIIDGELSARQKEVKSAIAEMETELNEQLASLNTLQLQVLNQMSEDENGENEETVQTVGTKINIKYAVFGGCIGLFLAFLGIMLWYIMGKHIKYSDEILELYGLPVIAELTEGKKKSRMLGAVDQWLERKRCRSIRTSEEQWNLMMANLSVTCRKQELNSIFVISSRHLDENERKLVDKMIAELNGKKITVEYGENVNYNADAFERMSESENVVLIEKIYASTYDDIEKEVRLCREQNLNILGAITIA